MSGPLPETDHDTATPALTIRQWQALGRLAERWAAIEEAASGPLGDAAADALRRVSENTREQDLARHAKELLTTVKALSDAGLLATLNEHAATLSEALQTLSGLAAGPRFAATLDAAFADLATWHRYAAHLRAAETFLAGTAGQALLADITDAVSALPARELAHAGAATVSAITLLAETGALKVIAESLPALAETARTWAPLASDVAALFTRELASIRADLTVAHDLAGLVRRLQEFWAGPAGTHAVAAMTEIGRRLGDEDVPGLVREILAVLVAWRDAGALTALREAAAVVAGGAALAGGHIPGVPEEAGLRAFVASQGPVIHARWQELRARYTRLKAETPEQSAGGLKGLYTLLMDPRVQDGVRAATTLLQAIAAAPQGPARPTR